MRSEDRNPTNNAIKDTSQVTPLLANRSLIARAVRPKRVKVRQKTEVSDESKRIGQMIDKGMKESEEESEVSDEIDFSFIFGFLFFSSNTRRRRENKTKSGSQPGK